MFLSMGSKIFEKTPLQSQTSITFGKQKARTRGNRAQSRSGEARWGRMIWRLDSCPKRVKAVDLGGQAGRWVGACKDHSLRGEGKYKTGMCLMVYFSCCPRKP